MALLDRESVGFCLSTWYLFKFHWRHRRLEVLVGRSWLRPPIGFWRLGWLSEIVHTHTHYNSGGGKISFPFSLFVFFSWRKKFSVLLLLMRSALGTRSIRSVLLKANSRSISQRIFHKFLCVFKFVSHWYHHYFCSIIITCSLVFWFHSFVIIVISLPLFHLVTFVISWQNLCSRSSKFECEFVLSSTQWLLWICFNCSFHCVLISILCLIGFFVVFIVLMICHFFVLMRLFSG